MKKRNLGESNLEVYPLCFGGNVFGWTIDEQTSFTILDAFLASGLNFIDTADIYSVWVAGNQGGESETVIGNWLQQRGCRDKIVLATKVGMKLSDDKKGLSQAHIMASVEGSLKRLQTDYIDLYQSHEDDPSVPLDETLEAYNKLIKQGKIRAIGASNYTAPRLQEALETSKEHNLPIYQSLQPQYNLYDRAGFEKELAPLCEKENIGVISYYSLARGFLSGKYRSAADASKSVRGKRVVEKYLDDRGMRILQALDTVAVATNTNPAQVSLAWLIAQPTITAPIVSATTLEQLDDLVGATRITLSDDMIARLNEASAY